MLVPAGFYLVLQFDQPGEHGWGTVMATDTAFVMALFIAHLAFDPSLINAAKLGILSASVVSAVAGIALLVWSSRCSMRPRPARS